eukprot:7269722-Prymnesium_polylepis.1
MPGSLRRPAYEAQPSVPNIERGSFDVDAVRTTTSSAITGEQDRSDNQQTAGFDEDNYWPFPREQLHRMSIRILSLHGLPKVKILPDPSIRAIGRRASQASPCYTLL